MSQAVMMRRSYRSVIEALNRNLGAKLNKKQRAHYTYLLSQANEAENKRQIVRRKHRRMVKASRKANRG